MILLRPPHFIDRNPTIETLVLYRRTGKVFIMKMTTSPKLFRNDSHDYHFFMFQIIKKAELKVIVIWHSNLQSKYAALNSLTGIIEKKFIKNCCIIQCHGKIKQGEKQICAYLCMKKLHALAQNEQIFENSIIFDSPPNEAKCLNPKHKHHFIELSEIRIVKK